LRAGRETFLAENALLNTAGEAEFWARVESGETIQKNGGPSSATFEQIKTITRFIQRFGTRVN